MVNMIEEKITGNMEGYCPYCESENIEHGVIVLDEDMAYFPVFCNDCHKSSEEWYEMCYTETKGVQE